MTGGAGVDGIHKYCREDLALGQLASGRALEQGLNEVGVGQRGGSVVLGNSVGGYLPSGGVAAIGW